MFFPYFIGVNGTVIPNFENWGNVHGASHNNPNRYNGYISPNESIAKLNNFEFQIQVWSLFRSEFLSKGSVDFFKLHI